MSNNFVKQYVMPVAVLLVICIVCVGVLSVLNDVLYVEVETTYETSTGKIVEYVANDDGSYTVTAIGMYGYDTGTVTMDIVVGADGVITAVTITDNDGQSFIDKITQYMLDGWYVGQSVGSNVALSNAVNTAASKTSNAINNAVNVVCEYCRIYLGLGGNA